MRLNKTKSLFESFEENLRESTIDENWCKEQAEYYFNQDCQDSGDLDEIDYVSIINDYTDNEAESKKVEELIHNAWKIIKDNIYNYDWKKYIQLGDNHTLFKIENDKFPSDDYAAEEYNNQVEFACEEFEEQTDVKLLLLGRSGRHACVELNYDNALRFEELQKIQAGLEQQVIDNMNSWEPEEESANPVNESDITYNVSTPNVDNRDYSIVDITELVQKSNGDVRPPMIDISELLVEAHNTINEEYGYNAVDINVVSTKTSKKEMSSNALFELKVGNKNFLMSMITECANGSRLRVNNTMGKTVFSRKTNNLSEAVCSYIKQFIPESAKANNEDSYTGKIENMLSQPGYEDLKYKYELILWNTKNLNKKDPDYETFRELIQQSMYAFVAELPAGDLNVEEPTEKTFEVKDVANLELPTHDSMVEELFGKEWVKEVEEAPEEIEITGAETLTEADETTDDIITDVPENNDEVADDSTEKKEGLGVGSATFVRKPTNLEAVRTAVKDGTTEGKSSYIIVDKLELSPEEFDNLCDNLSEPQEFLPIEPIDEENFAFNCIEVTGGKDYSLLIDPSSFNYPRYVAVKE